MGEYWDVLGEYDAETQAFSAFAGTVASPYSPLVQGTLVGIRIIVNAQAATSLTRGVIIRLTCTEWTPNTIQFAVAGNGLKTAPDPIVPTYDFALNLPVKTDKRITLEGRCIEGTHQTNSILVLGKFVA